MFRPHFQVLAVAAFLEKSRDRQMVGLIRLLGGGSKRRQDADIAAAIERWQRYQQAKKEK